MGNLFPTHLFPTSPGHYGGMAVKNLCDICALFVGTPASGARDKHSGIFRGKGVRLVMKILRILLLLAVGSLCVSCASEGGHRAASAVSKGHGNYGIHHEGSY